jgi:CubicO group peptidase (beta-lactamase class C family)
MMIGAGTSACLAALGHASAVHAADITLIGRYGGTLEAGPVRLRLTLVLASDNSATLFSVDQGNAAIPANSVKIDRDHVVLAFSLIGASYDARLTRDDTLDGVFTQSGQAMPLKLKRGVNFLAESPPVPLTQAGLAAFRAQSGTPALGAAWNRIGMPTGILVDGVRSAAGGAAVTANDKWHLGSMTKSMTAILVARLVAAGVMNWSDTVGHLLGALIPGIDPAYAKVSLLHLLCHRSGLPGDIPLEAIGRFSRKDGPDPRAERLSYAAVALALPPKARAGDEMIYANNGYIVVGAMLEQRMGKPWEALIADQLFGPLSLTSAGFGPPGIQGATDQPLGHLINTVGTRVPIFNDNPVALGPAGRVHLSLADLIRYLSAHRDRPAGFLAPEHWSKLHTPLFGGTYALGWFVGPEGALWHNGSNSLWYAEGGIDRAHGVVSAFVSNDARHMGGAPGRELRAAYLAALA